MDDRTKSQIAPSGIFAYGEYTVPCDGSNPLVSAAMLNELCFNRPDPLATGDIAHVGIARRNVEGGGRQDDLRHTSYRGVRRRQGQRLGATGTTTSRRRTARSSCRQCTRTTSPRSAPDARWTSSSTRTSGLPACRSAVDGTDPNCVPYNIWQHRRRDPGSPRLPADPAVRQWQHGTEDGLPQPWPRTSASTAWKLPTASDGIGVAFGAGYYENSLDFQTDANFASGDGAGQGGPTIGQSGGYNAIELFGEVRMPILQDMFMADNLALNASYRLFRLQRTYRRSDQHLRCRPRMGAD